MRTGWLMKFISRGWKLGVWSVGWAFALLSHFVGDTMRLAEEIDHKYPARLEYVADQASQDSVVSDEAATLRQKSRDRWQREITELLRAGAAGSHDAAASAGRSILFYGSSSIRLWDTIATDVSPLVPTRRGFGGAKSIDLAVFADEVLRAQPYDALVIFVANDISGEADQPEYSPDQVIGWLTEVVEVSRAWQPAAPILLVEVTPTPKRWDVWPRQLALNLRLREWTLSQPGVEFLATAEYFLDSQGSVRETLFDPDRLHLNPDGYRLWGRLIRRRVLEWRESAE